MNCYRRRLSIKVGSRTTSCKNPGLFILSAKIRWRFKNESVAAFAASIVALSAGGVVVFDFQFYLYGYDAVTVSDLVLESKIWRAVSNPARIVLLTSVFELRYKRRKELMPLHLTCPAGENFQTLSSLSVWLQSKMHSNLFCRAIVSLNDTQYNKKGNVYHIISDAINLCFNSRLTC